MWGTTLGVLSKLVCTGQVSSKRDLMSQMQWNAKDSELYLW